MDSYATFNTILREKISILVIFKDKCKNITPYKLNIKKVGELGSVLKQFYDLYDDAAYNDAFLYSFGFNGYIDNMHGFMKNIADRYICYAKFSAKKRKNIFKKSYYPTLMRSNPVKNDYNFKKNMILTGPNASGKTTILKSALINIIFSQQMGAGFYESAQLRPFDFIHCYLNIPDTSGRDSLFQAEARRCMEILDIVKDDENYGKTHFCAFDELYSGTNPEDAVMSALAFMEFLISSKNVSCILTTHFTKLCKKLDSHKAIENFHMKTDKNANVIDAANFNSDFIYTYLLKRGISQLRGGLKILYDMNYPKEIIDKTRQYSSL